MASAAGAGGAEEDVAEAAQQAAAFVLRFGGRRAGRAARLAGGGSAAQFFEGRFAVDDLFVVPVDHRVFDGGLAFGRGQRAEAGVGGDDEGALDDVGAALFVEEGDQRFADAQFGDDRGGVELGVGAHGFGGGLDGLLVLRGEGAQGVLDPVAELAEDAFGHIQRVLGDEIDADALGTDQPHHLFDFLEQRLGGVVEEQVGFVEKEHQLGFVHVAHFGQLLEEFGEHPQQEGGVELGRVAQLVGGEDVDDPATVGVGLHQVGDVEHRLAEEFVATLGFDAHQAALDGADGSGRDVAVFGGEILGVVAHILDGGAQILEVDDQQALVVGDLEDQLQHAGLGVVEVEQARQQQRTHVGYGGAHRVAGFAEDVPEHRGVGPRREFVDAQRGEAFLELGRFDAGGADARQIALHVGHEHRHADAGEGFRHLLEGDGLAGAGGAGDEAVTVGQLGQQGDFLVLGLGDEQGLGHGFLQQIRAKEALSAIIGQAPDTGMKSVPARRVGFGASAGCAKNRRRGKIAPLRREPRTQNHGGSFQVGQHPAPQGPAR